LSWPAFEEPSSSFAWWMCRMSSEWLRLLTAFMLVEA
jgi:hypothetical protein